MLDQSRHTLTRSVKSTIVGALLIFSVLTPTSQASMRNAHSFLTLSKDTEKGSCLICHVAIPEEGAVKPTIRKPSDTSKTYTTYVTLAGNTGDMQGHSKLCLSCHDGVTAPDAMHLDRAGSAGLGTDLRNDHPVGVNYPPRRRNGQLLPNYRRTPPSSIKLFGSANNRMECSSCHDPHGSENPKLLRVTIQGSQLCLACHDL